MATKWTVVAANVDLGCSYKPVTLVRPDGTEIRINNVGDIEEAARIATLLNMTNHMSLIQVQHLAAALTNHNQMNRR